MRATAKILILPLLASLAACGEEGQVFNKKPIEVAKAIRTAKFPLNGMDGSSSVLSSSAEKVEIVVKDRTGLPEMYVTAHIAPEGAGSRVVTEIRATEELKGFDPVNSKKFVMSHIHRAVTGKGDGSVHSMGLNMGEMDRQLSGKGQNGKGAWADDWGAGSR